MGESKSTGVGLSSVYAGFKAKVENSVSIIVLSVGGLTHMMNPFSKEADELLARSIELEKDRKPGEMYLDPVWGLVQVPYEDLDLGCPEVK